MTIENPKLCLIDGSGFIFRAFHALPSLTRPSDKVEVNAVFGFTKMLLSLINSTKYDYISVVFDAGKKTFRNDIYPEYKANRKAPPEELTHQFDIIKNSVEAFNICSLEREGFEADDLIATYTTAAKKAGLDVLIVSSDKDLMQLIDGDKAYMMDSIKKSYIKEAEVMKKFGIKPWQVTHAQALIGDSSDNIPGVKGVGPVATADLLSKFNTLEGVYENIDNISSLSLKNKLISGKENAFLSFALTQLKTDLSLDIPLSKLKRNSLNPVKLYKFLQINGFTTLAGSIVSEYKIAPAAISEVLESLQNNLSLNSTKNPALSPTPSIYPQLAEVACKVNIITTQQELASAIQSLPEVPINLYYANFSSENGNCIHALASENENIYLIITKDSSINTPDLFNEESSEVNKNDISSQNFIQSINHLFNDLSINKVVLDAKTISHKLSKLNVNILNSFSDIKVLTYALDGVDGVNSIEKVFNHELSLTINSLLPMVKNSENSSEALEQALTQILIMKNTYYKLQQRLVFEQAKYLYELVDKPLIKVLYYMEVEGILISKNVLLELGQSIELKLNQVEAEIFAITDFKFNIASPKQIGEVLFTKLGIKGKKNKSGSWKTKVDFLEELSDQGHEIASLIITWRQLSKLKTTYIESLPKHINPVSGRIHSSFVQTKVNTGRLSSLEPNLQNIPIRSDLGKQIRKSFVAKPGYKLVSLDYSQIELRVLADIANIKGLITAFESNQDIHTITATEIFNLTSSQVTESYRRKAKTINFGIIYGISHFGLASRLQISREEAKNYIDLYFARYPEIQIYMEQAKQEARDFGYVVTKFGRKCYIKEINNSNFNVRSFAERAAINAKLQGTAADIIRLAMIKTSDYLKQSGVDAKLLLQVHDELVIETSCKDSEMLAHKVGDIMENICKLKIPLIAKYAIGDNWMLAH